MRPSLVTPVFAFDDGGVARIAGEKLVAIIHHHFHRPAAYKRKLIRRRHIHEIAFAAEIAANVTGMDEKLLHGNAERGRQLVAQRKGHFAASPNFCAAGWVGVDHTGVRLDVSLVHHGGVKNIFNDAISAAKAFFDGALFPG